MGFQLGRLLILVGLVLVGIGAILLVANKLHLPLGRLPGDIVYRGRNTTIYFPLVTCLILSLLATLLFWLFNRR